MKLITAIIHDEDSDNLLDKLSEGQYMATKMSSTGGFLKSGNTTIMIVVEDEQVDSVISIIKENCNTKKEITIATPPAPPMSDNSFSYPIEVTVGGATVFVMDVDRFYKF